MASLNDTAQDFQQQLQEMWRAESMLTAAMPLMMEKASLPGLKKSLAMHHAETDQQKVALEAIARQLGFVLEEGVHEELNGLLAKGKQELTASSPGTHLDASILENAIAVEHFEIARYEKLAAAAKSLGLQGVHGRLQLSFEEERQALTKLLFLQKMYVKQSALLGMEAGDGGGLR